MPEASASVVIPHPASTVWEYCTVAENLAAFSPGTAALRSLSDGPIAVGSMWQGTTKILGRTMEWTGEFTRVDVNKGTELRSTKAPFGFTTSTEFEETSDGTKYTYHIVADSGMGGVFGKLADAVVARMYQKSLQAGVESLPELIDAWLAER